MQFDGFGLLEALAVHLAVDRTAVRLLLHGQGHLKRSMAHGETPSSRHRALDCRRWCHAMRAAATPGSASVHLSGGGECWGTRRRPVAPHPHPIARECMPPRPRTPSTPNHALCLARASLFLHRRISAFLASPVWNEKIHPKKLIRTPAFQIRYLIKRNFLLRLHWMTQNKR